MIAAAVYSRKSTDQDVTDAEKSVMRQIALARAFADSKGWTVIEEYVDDGISGRETAKLVNRARMLADATAGKFSVVIVRDFDRLSRDDREGPGFVYMLRDAGVEVWEYTSAAPIKVDRALDRGMLNMKASFSAHEAEAASTHTREKKFDRARRGEVADGKVYGYRTEGEAKQRRRVIDPEQAKVVVRIFERCAEGYGLLKIAKRLNAEGIPSPRGDGWASTAVREILHRPLYRGVLVYGKTTWDWSGTEKRKVRVPESEWITREVPNLRIVDERLWRAAHARIERTRATYHGLRGAKGGPRPGQLNGRPESALLSRHVLSGFLRCGVCDGNMFVAPVSGQRGGPQLYYRCTTHKKRGNTRCTNQWGLPYHDFTDLVLAQLKQRLLNPDVIVETVRQEMEARTTAPEEQRAQLEALRARLTTVEREIGRHTQAIAATDTDIPTLVEALKARQRERGELTARLEHLDGMQQAAASFDVEAFRRTLVELLAHFDVIAYHPAVPQQVRKILRTLLTGAITVTPRVGRDRAVTWEYAIPGTFAGLLRGVLDGAPAQGACPGATILVPPG